MPLDLKSERMKLTVKRYKILTRKHQAVIRAVGRLYDAHPAEKRFTMVRKGDTYVRGGYTWYREPWMDEMLNAYRLLKGKG